METESQNAIQDLKNKLLVRSLLENVEDLLKKEKKMKISIKNFLNGIINTKKLYKISFGDNYDYIKKYYISAVKIFEEQKEVSQLSYGIVYLYEKAFLYIKKGDEESLNFLTNFQSITPINFDNYIYKKGEHHSINTNLLLNAGQNINGYSFEFNVNFFFSTLSNLIEIPDLIINIQEDKIPFFKELDIAYYNKEKIKNENLSLLKTSAYYNIIGDTISFNNKKNFEIFHESLILGEVKASFPKYVKLNIDKEKKEKKEKSLEDIINSLFEKLDFFYGLYAKLDWIDISKMENIQLIFFYDYVQVGNLKANILIDIIKNNKTYYKKFNKIPIHLFIVYTIPSISVLSICELKKEIKELEGKDSEKNKKIKELEEKNKSLEGNMKQQNNEIKKLQVEMENLKKNYMLQNTSQIEKKELKVENESTNIMGMLNVFSNDNKNENINEYNNNNSISLNNINNIQNNLTNDIFSLINNNNINNENNSNINKNINNDIFDFFNFIDNNDINNTNNNIIYTNNNINNSNNIILNNNNINSNIKDVNDLLNINFNNNINNNNINSNIKDVNDLFNINFNNNINNNNINSNINDVNDLFNINFNNNINNKSDNFVNNNNIIKDNMDNDKINQDINKNNDNLNINNNINNMNKNNTFAKSGDLLIFEEEEEK